MNITKNNFKEYLPLIKEAVEGSHFIAIDTELTGLGTNGIFNAFDSMPERYSKIQKNCSKYLIIQYGVSCFKYHPKQKKYTHQDFNFYIFPKPCNRQSPDPIFTCQTTSIHFLISHGFDFNKTMSEGISYLNPMQEEKVRQYLKDKHQSQKEDLESELDGSNKLANQKIPAKVQEENKNFIEKICSQMDAFMFDETETVLRLDPCNSFLRRLTYQTIHSNYPAGIDTSSSINDKNETFITVIKASEEERFEKLQLKQIEDMDDVDAAVGFRKVMDFISQSKKLVVGHNMLLDLIHTMNQFFSPLPEHLEDFKELVRCIFPHVLDTKNMASSEPLKGFIPSKSLPDLLKEVQGKAFRLPTVEPEDGFKGYSLDDNRLHEAGYDAFITGVCYIGMKTKLGMLQSPAVDYVSSASDIVSPYVNKIFIMMHYDITHLNLSGADSQPSRENVFYVTFPRQWKTVDIVDLFQPFGRTYIHWLNDVSALVALKNADQALNVKTALVRNVNSLYNVKPFAEYKNLNPRNDSLRDKRTVERSHLDSPVPSKRRSSGGLELPSNRSIEPIPEGDENEAETVDNSVSTSHESYIAIPKKSKASYSGSSKAKRRKLKQEQSEAAEVSSTAKLFDEENAW